ncbi:MAG: NUDIX domain-containing protein [Bdellovibrionota bacterium]|jgi:8-oxo-dGTP pyrophosphatase MutT (NUDIX family)
MTDSPITRRQTLVPSWEMLSSRLVYENTWMKLREDRVITPAGGEGIYGWLELPDAVVVLAVTEAQELILIGQDRYPVHEYTWELIEGAIEEGETPLQAAVRELKEEAGLTSHHLRPLGPPFHIANTRTNEVAHVFLATELEFGTAHPEETEILEVKRIPLKDAYEMVDNGSIRDSLTIIALLRYRNLISR